MDFKLNGRKYTPTNVYSAPLVKKYLDSLPDGELINTPEIAAIFKIRSPGYFRDKAVQDLPDYRFMLTGKWLFGSKKTISALKKQLEIV
jgi:hypothetical protein